MDDVEEKEGTDLESVSVSDRLHLLPTDRRDVVRRRLGIHRLSIQTVYREGLILKTWHPVVVLSNGGEVARLLTTELVLRAPRWWRGGSARWK